MRQINSADVEHYYGGLVMEVAITLQQHANNTVTWDEISHRSKQNYLNKAVKVVKALINSDPCMLTLKRLAERQ